MATYEYEVLTLQRVPGQKENEFHWRSDRRGVLGKPTDIGVFLNRCGNEGWHIGTHVSDGRFGNMIVLEREVDAPAPAPASPVPVLAPFEPVAGSPVPVDPAVLSSLQAIQRSLGRMEKQGARPAPVPAPVLVPLPAEPQMPAVLQALQQIHAQLQCMGAAAPAAGVECLIPYLQALQPVPADSPAPEKRSWLAWLRVRLGMVRRSEAIATA